MACSRSVIRFVLADESHDAAIRRLLRDSPMEGKVRLSLQREPSYFRAAEIEGCDHRTILAIQGERVVCAGSVSVRQRFYNGRPVRMGYLGSLRLDPEFSGRVDILRGGYQLFHQLHAQSPVGVYLTSIAADNLPAIRLLERGLPGFPQYRHAGDLATIAIRVRRGSSRRVHRKLQDRGFELRQGTSEMSSAIPQFLNDQNARFQFAPLWSTAEIDRLLAEFSMRSEGFRLLWDGGRFVGCAAIWDQRAFKQAVISRYTPALTLIRPLYNAAARLLGRVALPTTGRAMPQVYVSHLGLPQDDAELLGLMLLALMDAACAAGATMMLLGLDARDPRLPAIVHQFRPLVYRTRLYLVRWSDQTNAIEPPDDRLIYPEVALL